MLMTALTLAAALMAQTAQPYPELDVPQDPEALYQVLRTQILPDGTREIITARTGRRGTTFVKRFYWCDRGTHRVMGSGGSVQEMMDARPAWNSKMTEPETVAGVIGEFVCGAGGAR